MKTLKQLLGEELERYRKRAQKSVLDVVAKTGLKAPSIYDIEAGEQNVTADTYEKLLSACGVTPEQWLEGCRNRTGKSELPARHDDLFAMLETVVRANDEDSIRTVRGLLDAMADRALDRRQRAIKDRASPGPPIGAVQDAPVGPQESGRTNSRKPKKQESSSRG